MNLIEQATQPILEYRTIPLTKGQVARISQHRYDWAMQWNWYATWCENSRSYYAVRMAQKHERLNGPRRKIYLHRQIKGEPPNLQVDHEDFDTLNCVDDNLRIGTEWQNRQHARMTRQNTSGFVGVTKHSQYDAWIAYISHQNKRLHIGVFMSAIGAARGRDRVALRLRGKFAKLNFPIETYGNIKTA